MTGQAGRELTSALGCACVGLPVVLETCLAQATSALQPLPKPLTTSQPGWHGAQPPARVPRGSGWPQLLWPGCEPSVGARPEWHTPLGVPAVAGAARGLRPPRPPPEPCATARGWRGSWHAAAAAQPVRGLGRSRLSGPVSPRSAQVGCREQQPRAPRSSRRCRWAVIRQQRCPREGASPPGTGTPWGPRTLPGLVPLPRPAAAAHRSPFADASALQSSFISASEAPRES